MVDFLPVSERNLILTGYIGPNQPLLGRQIAERLHMPFVTFDMLIAERIDLPVSDIRTYYGERRLRAIEAELIQENVLRRHTLIRVSGRTLVDGDNLARLQETGPVIFLFIALDAMLSRLHVDMGARYHSPQERALALGELKREWAIRGAPGIYELDVTLLEEDEIVEQVATLWESITIERG